MISHAEHLTKKALEKLSDNTDYNNLKKAYIYEKIALKRQSFISPEEGLKCVEKALEFIKLVKNSENTDYMAKLYNLLAVA